MMDAKFKNLAICVMALSVSAALAGNANAVEMAEGAALFQNSEMHFFMLVEKEKIVLGEPVYIYLVGHQPMHRVPVQVELYALENGSRTHIGRIFSSGADKGCGCSGGSAKFTSEINQYFTYLINRSGEYELSACWACDLKPGEGRIDVAINVTVLPSAGGLTEVISQDTVRISRSVTVHRYSYGDYCIRYNNLSGNCMELGFGWTNSTFSTDAPFWNITLPYQINETEGAYFTYAPVISYQENNVSRTEGYRENNVTLPAAPNENKTADYNAFSISFANFSIFGTLISKALPLLELDRILLS